MSRRSSAPPGRGFSPSLFCCLSAILDRRLSWSGEPVPSLCCASSCCAHGYSFAELKRCAPGLPAVGDERGDAGLPGVEPPGVALSIERDEVGDACVPLCEALICRCPPLPDGAPVARARASLRAAAAALFSLKRFCAARRFRALAASAAFAAIAAAFRLTTFGLVTSLTVPESCATTVVLARASLVPWCSRLSNTFSA